MAGRTCVVCSVRILCSRHRLSDTQPLIPAIGLLWLSKSPSSGTYSLWTLLWAMNFTEQTREGGARINVSSIMQVSTLPCRYCSQLYQVRLMRSRCVRPVDVRQSWPKAGESGKGTRRETMTFIGETIALYIPYLHRALRETADFIGRIWMPIFWKRTWLKCTRF